MYKAGYEGLIGNVEAFNENYIRSGITRFVTWYGIAGVYPVEPYSGEKEAALRANWPWSGHYEINPACGAMRTTASSRRSAGRNLMAAAATWPQAGPMSR